MTPLTLILGLALGVIAAGAAGVLIWFGKIKVLNPVRTFAVFIVAVISGYIMWMGYRLTDVLDSPDWCSKAIQAERITPGASFKGLEACVDLLTLQLRSLATNSHIYAGVIAMCLLTLIVIVIAQGRLEVEASKTGVKTRIGRDEERSVANAVDETVAAAENKGEEIKAEAKADAKFTPPPGEEL